MDGLTFEQKKKEIQDSLASIPEEIIDINQVLREIKTSTQTLDNTLEQNKKNKKLLFT